MRQIFYFLITCSLLMLNNLLAMEKLQKPLQLKTSVVIPCHYVHAPLLFEALSAYANQSCIPNEVVVSLSEVEIVPDTIIEQLKNYPWPFSFIFLCHKEKVSEGGNRNRACTAAIGDILICSDADDLPHPQRVQIIKYFFENYPIEFLIHTYVHDTSSWCWIDAPDIEFSVPKAVNEGGPHANGAVSIRKHLHEKHKWNEAFRKLVDVDFNGTIYWTCPNRILIKAPIYHYRSDLTSYPD